MDLTGEYTIPATRQQVWEALNDPEVLKTCIPGCEEMEKESDTEITAKVTLKVGAVKARMKGKVTLSDIDAPNSYTISGQGQGGVAGFAKGSSQVTLTDGPDGGTVLRYEARAELGGKLAAVGSRVIQGVSKKMADDFFGKFAAHFTKGADAKPEGASSDDPLANMTPEDMVRHLNLPDPPKPAPERGGMNELPGTVRDVIWFGLGVIFGGLIIWALYN